MHYYSLCLIIYKIKFIIIIIFCNKKFNKELINTLKLKYSKINFTIILIINNKNNVIKLRLFVNN